ncbi:hypothetical protein H5410_009881 [Solanum commersonii]|uniref:Uncharacterized protein n=1 Tax=Solanum commersonii TaxID=4109 RepID=A0A9J6AKX4_SOLCO|nr:hypothetical protein H5410_009881 [Solanum commersonii]
MGMQKVCGLGQLRVLGKQLKSYQLPQRKNEEKKRTNRKTYKTMKNEVRTVVTAAKMTTLEPLYEELENRGGEKKARERRTRDLDQLRCIKDKDGKVLVEEKHIK